MELFWNALSRMASLISLKSAGKSTLEVPTFQDWKDYLGHIPSPNTVSTVDNLVALVTTNIE